MRKLYCFLISVALTACSSVNQSDSTTAFLNQPLQQMLELDTGTLDNGLSYFILPYDVEEISVSLIIHAGSLDENDDEKGLAHLLEHMAFKGTENFTAAQIEQMLKNLGQQYGSDVNAATYGDITEYYVDLAPGSTSNISFSALLEWYADIAHGRFIINQTDLAIERGIVNAERVYRSDSSYWEDDYQLLYSDSSMRERDPIGDKDIVANATKEQLQRFALRNYSPANATLLVTGNLSERQVAYIKNVFSSGENSQPIPRRKGVTINTDTLYYQEDNASAFTHAQLLSPMAPLETNRDMLDDFLLIALNDVLQQRMNHADDNDTRVNFYSEVGYEYIESYDASYLYVEHDNQSHEQIVSLIKQQLKDLETNGLSATEREYLTTFFQTYITEDVTDWSPRSYIGELYYASANNSVFPGPVQSDAVIEQALAQVNDHYLNDYVKRWAARPIRWGFSGTQLDQESLNSAMLASLTAAKASDIQNTAPLVALPQPRATPAEIVAESNVIAAKVLTLDNGITVILERRDEAEMVSYYMMAAGGSQGLTSDKELAASFMALDVVASSGHEWGTSAQLDEYLYNNDLMVYPYIDTYDHGLSVESEPFQTEQALNLIYAMYTDIVVDEDVFEQTKRATIDEVKAWDSLDDFYVALDQVRFEGGSEYSRLTIDWLEQVSSEDIVKLYQDYLIPANGYVVSIVGQFDEQKVIDDIRRYLGAIPKGQPYELSNVRSYQEPSTTIIERTGAEPEQSLVSYGYVSPKSDRVSFTQQAADSIAIAIAQERLEMEMRETKGWVYGVEEYFSVAYGRVAETTIDFEMYTSPVHTDDLISHTESVINELLSQGITNDEYERHLESYLTHVQYSIDDDYTMSFLYADSYVKGLDIVDMINYPITLSNVTKSMIEDRMLTLFDPAGLTIGVLTE